MTQTLQDALLKAGLVSAEKLKRAQQDQKAAQRAHRPPSDHGNHSAQGAKGNFSRPSFPKKTASSAAQPIKASPPSSAKRPDFAPRPKPSFAKPAVEKKGPGFLEHKHIHHLRTDCDSCQKSSPDVEYYEHPNKSFQYYWLCVKCADDHSILDQYRQTKQSQHAMSGFFRRNYGPTKIFR